MTFRRSRLLFPILLALPHLHGADSALRFQKVFGGSANDTVSAVASAPSGGAIVAGFTASYDFPVTDGSRNIATQFPITAEDGVSWNPLGNLPAGVPWSLAVGGGKSPGWYVTAPTGVYKSTDGGVTWTEAGPHGLPRCNSAADCSVLSVTTDPQHPDTIYGRSS